MKTLKDFINESFRINEGYYPMAGTFRKGDDAVVVIIKTKEGVDPVINPDDLWENPKAKEVIKTTIDKVVSKDVGRYSGDQHTWVYVTIDNKPVRFELKDYFEKYEGVIDYDYRKNPQNLDAIICTPESYEALKDSL